MNLVKRNLLAMLLLVLCGQYTVAQDSAIYKTIQRFATEDVEAVARLDLAQVNLPGLVGELTKFGMIDEDQAMLLRAGGKQVQEVVEKFRSAGVQSIFVFARMTDLAHQGTTVVLTTESNDAANALVRALKGIQNGEGKTELFAELQPSILNLNHFEAMETFVVATSAMDQMELAKQAPATKRELDQGSIELMEKSFGLVIFGSKDSRMAIRQMLPTLDPPFEEVTGPFIADELNWGGVSITLSEKITMDIKIKSAKSGEQLSRVLKKILTALPDLPALKATGLPGLKKVIGFLDVDESDGLVTVSSKRLMANPKAFRNAISPRIDAVRKMSRETIMQNNLREIIIAMHNYYDMTSGFPVSHSTSPDGKPLLSWRVHLLPLMEQGELYKRFKLDEPWDSEHNRKLIPLMPNVYADAMAGGTENNRAGKTVFQVPVGEGTMFEKMVPCKFSDIKDGTSNTIAIVTVAQDNAVIWTKPADWKVDVKDARQGLVDGKRDSIPVVLGDASAHLLPATVKSKTLLHLLQIADGNIVNWPN